MGTAHHVDPTASVGFTNGGQCQPNGSESKNFDLIMRVGNMSKTGSAKRCIDGAPRVHQAPGGESHRGLSSMPSDTGVMPPKIHPNSGIEEKPENP